MTEQLTADSKQLTVRTAFAVSCLLSAVYFFGEVKGL